MRIEIIPAIDIIDGKCVRLTKGDYEQKKIYNENPLEVAKQFEDAGISRLHLVDLDGAKSSKIINHKILHKIANNTKLIIDFGGGIKTDSDIETAFESGAYMVNIGSIAIRNKQLFLKWLNIYGQEKIMLSADVKNNKVAGGGWLEESEKGIIEFIEEYSKEGIKKVVCTDVSKDGMLTGSSVELYREIMIKFPEIYLIASGGVNSMEELDELVELGAKGAIIGKAIYENKISLKQLSDYIHAK